MRLDFWRYFVFNDPNWDWRTFDWDQDLAFARRKLPMIDAVYLDLTAFKSHGGKIVMYLAWDDPIHISQSSLNYYESVEHAMGGAPKTADFFRLFLAPGRLGTVQAVQARTLWMLSRCLRRGSSTAVFRTRSSLRT